MKLPHLTTSLKNGGYLGQMCNTSVDMLGKCAIPRWISWANVLYTAGLKYWYDYFISYTLLKTEAAARLVTFIIVGIKSGVPAVRN
jgi:uncharacterized membrane protein YcfT